MPPQSPSIPINPLPSGSTKVEPLATFFKLVFHHLLISELPKHSYLPYPSKNTISKRNTKHGPQGWTRWMFFPRLLQHRAPQLLVGTGLRGFLWRNLRVCFFRGRFKLPWIHLYRGSGIRAKHQGFCGVKGHIPLPSQISMFQVQRKQKAKGTQRGPSSPQQKMFQLSKPCRGLRRCHLGRLHQHRPQTSKRSRMAIQNMLALSAVVFSLSTSWAARCCERETWLTTCAQGVGQVGLNQLTRKPWTKTGQRVDRERTLMSPTIFSLGGKTIPTSTLPKTQRKTNPNPTPKNLNKQAPPPSSPSSSAGDPKISSSL